MCCVALCREGGTKKEGRKVAAYYFKIRQTKCRDIEHFRVVACGFGGTIYLSRRQESRRLRQVTFATERERYDKATVAAEDSCRFETLRNKVYTRHAVFDIMALASGAISSRPSLIYQ